MVLRSSISNTRKFFQKTIENFKSFFSNDGTYHKLPKTPNNISINNHHPHPHRHHHHQNPNIIIPSSSTSSIQRQFQPKPRDYATKNRALTPQPRREDRDEALFSKPKVEVVRQKLEEMEKMMNDDEHVSDLREFLHCYSRLRCVAYLDVVEQFFMEVYSDFFNPQPLDHTREAVRSRYVTAVGVRSYGGQKN